MNTIEEGQEYRIVRKPDNRIMYEGIAESDEEADERLESLAMYLRAVANLPYPITLEIIPTEA